MENVDLVDYSKQREMDVDMHFNAATHKQVNIIIGCGGIGFWLGIQLAMLGFENFVLIDNDTISASNLNRLPVPQTWIGTSKSVALRKMIRFLRPFTTVHIINSKITEDTMESYIQGNNRNNPSDLCVWDTTDDARIGKKILAFSRNRYMTYRKMGYEGYKIGTYTEYDVWTTEDYTRGYRTSKANVLSSSIASALGIMSYGLNVTDDVDIDLSHTLRGFIKNDPDEDDEDNDDEEEDYDEDEQEA